MKTHNVVSVSGGKDSTLTALRAVNEGAENLSLAFADTGNEHEDTYAYLDYLEEKLGLPIKRVRADFTERFKKRREFLVSDRAKETWPEKERLRALELMVPTGNPFLDSCFLHGRTPKRIAQFCTRELKIIPINTQVVAPLLDNMQNRVVVWQGVRRDESPKRKDLETWHMDYGDPETGLGLWNYRPLLDLTATDVFSELARAGIEPNPLYKQGLTRVGCMPCINVSKMELREIANRFPQHIERIAEWERLISQVTRGGAATWLAVKGVDTELITLEEYGIEARVDWSRTRRGGKQYDLFQESPTCQSAYGLCE